MEQGEDAAKTWFEVARTLGDGTGGRKLVYNPGAELFFQINKDGDPIGDGFGFGKAKALYRKIKL